MAWETDSVVFIADDLGAWLIGLLADAGRKKLTTLVLGSDQERALRSAATAAVRRTANELCPDNQAHAQELAMVVGQVFSGPVPAPLTAQKTVLEALQAGIAGQLTVLDDANLTGTGQSSADVLGVRVTELAANLTAYLMREIVSRGALGGPLEPLANQLDHEMTQRMVGRLGDEVRDALNRLDTAHAVATTPVSLAQSGYIAHVRNIAPIELKDRNAELDELAAFCSGDEPYTYWQAGPYAGKSALMSWFVLHPPAKVDVVSFFVIRRVDRQNNSDAFIAVLTNQLAALIGEAPPQLASFDRQNYWRGLLREAAARSRGNDRRLVLVVDGMDEDRGATPGSGLPSIASILPKLPDEGIRIILSGRPNPRIPMDVAPDHPMRTCAIRLLDISAHGQSVESLAKSELHELLTGGQTYRRALGLIAVCGDALGQEDLAELTKRAPYELDRLLSGNFGRAIKQQANAWGSDSRPRFLLAHDALQAEALQQLGASLLAESRARINRWADDYRTKGWPVTTPFYLLRSYPGMLQAQHDLPRLAALASDPLRHAWMLDATGSDGDALAEIKAAQDLILQQPDPDLLSMLRIAIHRRDLSARNDHMPVSLPILWATIGQFVRAESLARSGSDPRKQINALLAVAEVAIGAGDRVRALKLTETAESVAESIYDPDNHDRVLAAIAKVTAKTGDYVRLQSLTQSINSPDWQGAALVAGMEAAIGVGDYANATRLAATAESLAPTIYPYWRHGIPYPREEILISVVRAVAGAGDHRRAEIIARSIDSHDQERALVAAVQAMAVSGNHAHAEVLIGSLADARRQVEALAALAEVLIAAGDGHGTALAETAESVALSITDPYDKAKALVLIARAAANGGDLTRADRLVESTRSVASTIRPEYRQQTLLPGVIEAALAAGDYVNAESIALSIAAPDGKFEALASIENVAIGVGDYARAIKLAKSAERAARLVPGHHLKNRALLGIVKAVVAAGDYVRAESIALSISDPYGKIDALAAIATGAVGTEDRSHGTRLAEAAESIARTITPPHRQDQELVAIVRAMLIVDTDTAKIGRTARSIANPHRQIEALLAIAEAATAAGDRTYAAKLVATAESITRAIDASYRQADAFLAISKTAAAAGDFANAARLAEAAKSSRLSPSNVDTGTSVAERMNQALQRTVMAILGPGLDTQATAIPAEVKALVKVAKAAADKGDYKYAESKARSIEDKYWQVEALTAVIDAVASRGENAQAMKLAKSTELILRSIVSAELQAQALVAIAAAISQDYNPAYSRQLITRALSIGNWATLLPTIARLNPEIVRAIIDEKAL